MAKQRFEADVPEGLRLGFSKDSEGGMRGLLFDEETGNLVGQAEFFNVDDDDHWQSPAAHGDPNARSERNGDEGANDEFVEVVSQALAILIIHGVSSAAPHVKQWWKDKAAPAVKAAPTKVTSRLKRIRSKNADDGIVSADLVITHVIEASDASSRPTMTSAEAQQRLLDAVLAMAFAQEQMRQLHDATISDGEGPLGLASTLKELSPENVAEAIHRMLEADPSVLERENLAAFKVPLAGTRLTVSQAPVGERASELQRSEGE